ITSPMVRMDNHASGHFYLDWILESRSFVFRAGRMGSVQYPLLFVLNAACRHRPVPGISPAYSTDPALRDDGCHIPSDLLHHEPGVLLPQADRSPSRHAGGFRIKNG